MIVLGLLASLDPVRPVVFVLVLRTQLVNALAFLVGWTAALAALFVIAFVVFGGDVSGRPRSNPPTWSLVVQLLLGGVLLVVAARRWRSRGQASAPRGAPQAVLRRLDGLHPRTAGLMGVLIQPRTLTIAAAFVVARDRSGVFSLLIGFAVFAVVSTAALLGILVYDIKRPLDAQRRLATLVAGLERQEPMIVTALCVAGGTYLVFDAVRHLVIG